MSLNGLFLSFSALCDFLKKYFFSKKKFQIFLKKIIFPNVSNSCSLNIFEPKIWRRLGTFPSCLFQGLGMRDSVDNKLDRSCNQKSR